MTRPGRRVKQIAQPKFGDTRLRRVWFLLPISLPIEGRCGDTARRRGWQMVREEYQLIGEPVYGFVGDGITHEEWLAVAWYDR